MPTSLSKSTPRSRTQTRNAPSARSPSLSSMINAGGGFTARLHSYNTPSITRKTEHIITHNDYTRLSRMSIKIRKQVKDLQNRISKLEKQVARNQKKRTR